MPFQIIWHLKPTTINVHSPGGSFIMWQPLMWPIMSKSSSRPQTQNCTFLQKQTIITLFCCEIRLVTIYALFALTIKQWCPSNQLWDIEQDQRRPFRSPQIASRRKCLNNDDDDNDPMVSPTGGKWNRWSKNGEVKNGSGLSIATIIIIIIIISII